MVFGAAAAASAASAGVTGTTLYGYNRKNFMYDRNMRQEVEYSIMEMKIKRAELFREDVHDIIGLTSVKMDTYLLVNAIQLGFCVMMFCEGRLSPETPAWLVGCHTLALAGAFLYLLMSVWLAMHATVAAKSYETRLLTQLVRLPVPSWAQIEGARTYGSAFEKSQTKQMFRVPFAMGSQESVLQCCPGGGSATQGEGDGLISGPSVPDLDEVGGPGAKGVGSDGKAVSTDPWGLERPGDDIYELNECVKADPRQLRHIELVRKAALYWQSYDGFSRVAMSVGTNQLVTALSYYVLGYVLVNNHAIIAAFLTVLIFMAIACAIIRLDMSLTAAEYQISVLLVMTGPLCMCASVMYWAQHGDGLPEKILVPITYVAQCIWLLFILYISKIRDQQYGVQLPTGFRSVMFVDVFGWIQDNFASKALNFLGRRPDAQREPEKTNAAGPGVQSVKYANWQPVPMRVEDLPGASRAPRDPDVSRADFAPNTFVPRERGDPDEVEAVASVEVEKAGTRPWKVFFGATSLLAVLWFLSGALMTMRLLGIQTLTVTHLVNHPNKKDPFAGEGLGFLQVGQALRTSWPEDNIHALGLACNGASNFAVVSSRYGLYTADISDASKGNRVQFQAAPPCREIEGDPLQDVSLMCHSEGGACQIGVLHQQGQKLSTCDLEGASESKSQGKSASRIPSALVVENEWLNDGDAAGTAPAESVRSFALTSACVAGNAQDCAYVGTSRGRLVAMQQTAGSGANRKLFPHQLLRKGLNVTESGAMDVISGRYLGLLQRDGGRVDVLDLDKDGAPVDSLYFPSPAKQKAWTSMCVAGDSIYLLSDGPSPQLSRFAVPEKLRSKSMVKSPQSHIKAGAQPTLLSSSAHRSRLHVASHVSLGVSSEGSSNPEPRLALRR